MDRSNPRSHLQKKSVQSRAHQITVTVDRANEAEPCDPGSRDRWTRTSLLEGIPKRGFQLAR